MIDAVLSYHLNPNTCGVARFNQLLAQKLGVPFGGLDGPGIYPLVSIKFAEYDSGEPLVPGRRYDLFIHDAPTARRHVSNLLGATRLYAANSVIATAIRRLRPDVIEAFCPSTLQGNPTRAALNVLTFGMAHKLQLPYYEKLKALLDESGQDYTVSVSTAVHEGSPWDAVSEAGEKLRAIFGDKTRVLGYLADDALAKELQDCSAVAMFFDPALRANNTTFWAARESGKPVIYNGDADSPIRSNLEIDNLTHWPIGKHGDYCTHRGVFNTFGHTWDALLQMMGVSVNV